MEPPVKYKLTATIRGSIANIWHGVDKMAIQDQKVDDLMNSALSQTDLNTLRTNRLTKALPAN